MTLNTKFKDSRTTKIASEGFTFYSNEDNYIVCPFNNSKAEETYSPKAIKYAYYLLRK